MRCGAVADSPLDGPDQYIQAALWGFYTDKQEIGDRGAEVKNVVCGSASEVPGLLEQYLIQGLIPQTQLLCMFNIL